ncbi:hypothetical protein KCU78_g12985, partial [Aureobasidium melanogenum]
MDDNAWAMGADMTYEYWEAQLEGRIDEDELPDDFNGGSVEVDIDDNGNHEKESDTDLPEFDANTDVEINVPSEDEAEEVLIADEEVESVHDTEFSVLEGLRVEEGGKIWNEKDDLVAQVDTNIEECIGGFIDNEGYVVKDGRRVGNCYFVIPGQEPDGATESGPEEDPEDDDADLDRELADDEYEEEDENGRIIIKKRSADEPDVEQKPLVLDNRVADNLTVSLDTIMLRHYMDANVTHTTRDEEIDEREIVRCTTHKDIDTNASYAFELGDQTDSVQEVAEHLKRKKTIRDGGENWIPFGDVYRHPRTHKIEVRAIPENKLRRMAKSMKMSTKGVLKELGDQVRREGEQGQHNEASVASPQEQR